MKKIREKVALQSGRNGLKVAVFQKYRKTTKAKSGCIKSQQSHKSTMGSRQNGSELGTFGIFEFFQL